MSETLDVLAEESKVLTSPEEDVLLNADDDIIDAQDDSFNEDEWYDVLDTSKTQEADILEISDSGKELDAEKSNDSEDGDESPTQRGKFITERNTPTKGDGIVTKRKKITNVINSHGVQRNFHHAPNKRMHSHFGNRNGIINGPRMRFNSQHNRFNRFPNPNPQRFRPRSNFSTQSSMMRTEFRPNMPFNPMQQMMPQVPMMHNNFPNPAPENFQQFPVYPQYVINQNPSTFQNAFMIPNQVQMPQQMPFISNQQTCNIGQFSGPVQGMMMQPAFPTQQPLRMPIQEQLPIPPSDFSVTVTTSTNPNRTESRTVLINPHFKGKVDVQNAQLLWDTERNQRNEGNNFRRRNLDDNELLRQQEEFINQNRRNLQKRMQRPRYVQRDSSERDYRTPPRFRDSSIPRRFENTRNEASVKTSDHQKNVVPIVKEPEDEATKLYRKGIEDQRRQRELYLKQKEERRRQRMQNEEALIDSTVKDKETISTETDPDVIITGVGFKEENVHNRLNKPVHRTGVLNLKTGLIKPKTETVIEKNELALDTEGSSSASKLNITVSKVNVKLSNTEKQMCETKSLPSKSINEIQSKQINKSTTGNSTQTSSSINSSNTIKEIDEELKIEDIQVSNVSSAPDEETVTKSIEPKAGFLGRRMVIASNASKHNIVVQADASESSNEHPANRSSGIFSNVVVNQEFSDDEEFLNFLEEPL